MEKEFSIWALLLSFVKGETRWHRYRDDLRRQVLERGEIPDSVWNSSDRLKIARKIEDILAANCWDEHFRFYPDDPYIVIGEFEVGDLSEVEAIMDIEDSFNIKIPNEKLESMLAQGISFGGFVDYIIHKTAIS